MAPSVTTASGLAGWSAVTTLADVFEVPLNPKYEYIVLTYLGHQNEFGGTMSLVDIAQTVLVSNDGYAVILIQLSY